jgi:hypothetical protein
LLIDPAKMAVLTSIKRRDSCLREAQSNHLIVSSLIVIIGFNTDIEHNGVVYHVQTEDKGLNSPLILSLVYSGGAILAAKRSRYEDLIAAGFDEEELSQRVKRQHRLICAAINAGRIEDLKRMGVPRAEDGSTEAREPGEETVAPTLDEVVFSTADFELVGNASDIEVISNAADYAALAEAPPPPLDEEIAVIRNADDFAALAEASPPALVEEVEVVRNADDYALRVEVVEAPPPPLSPAEPVTPDMSPAPDAADSPYTVYDSRRQSPLGVSLEPEKTLVLSILEEQEYWAGQAIQLRILVGDRSEDIEKPLAGVLVSVKILGTGFRPQIYSVKTERNGVAVVSAQVPKFTSGRAAILIRAVANDRTAETRRVIHTA